MDFLRSLFAPHQDAVWQQLASEIGARFIPGGSQGGRVCAQVGGWEVTFDVHDTGGLHGLTLTRLRAPYVNPDGFHFAVYRGNIFTRLGTYFGLQDVEIGDPDFDDAFVIKASDEAKARALFGDARIRHLIRQQPDIRLEVRDDEGWFGDAFPDGVDELSCQIVGVVTDIERLRALYELFAETLDHLCHLGPAYEDDPRRTH
ncbi:MAG TPA: DUF3137 domain-containing protein [Blastocatellia bacterium]|nr:DUF3137 domain-containing protein [Blastocatellia bacterium]